MVAGSCTCGAWTAFSTCSANCRQTRTRTCTAPSTGVTCQTEETQECTDGNVSNSGFLGNKVMLLNSWISQYRPSSRKSEILKKMGTKWLYYLHVHHPFNGNREGVDDAQSSTLTVLWKIGLFMPLYPVCECGSTYQSSCSTEYRSVVRIVFATICICGNCWQI